MQNRLLAALYLKRTYGRKGLSLCLPLTDSMEKFLLEKLLVSHLTNMFQLFREHERCILTYREAYFMSQLICYHNLTSLFNWKCYYRSSLWSFRIKTLYAYLVSPVRTVGFRHLVLFIFNTKWIFNPFHCNFSANRILPSSYLFWAVKRLVDYL
jgi:hypothetical protein